MKPPGSNTAPLREKSHPVCLGVGGARTLGHATHLGRGVPPESRCPGPSPLSGDEQGVLAPWEMRQVQVHPGETLLGAGHIRPGTVRPEGRDLTQSPVCVAHAARAVSSQSLQCPAR